MRIQTAGLTPAADTLVALLRRQAEHYCDKVVFGYSDNGDDDGLVTLSYAELDRRARAIAATLQAHGAAGHRVLVFCRPGLDHIAAFFGCWYAGAIAVPVNEQVPPRLSFVIPDAQPGFVLVPSDAPAQLMHEVDGLVALVGEQPLRWVLTDRGDPEAWVPPVLDPDATAVLHYTSGTVVAPKGVLVSHRNIVCNIEAIRRTWGGDDSAIGVSWLSLEQNMGLISQMLVVIACGSTGFGMSADAFRRRPMRWLEAVAHRRATSTSAPAHAYAMCLEASTSAERAALDLSCLTDLSAGAQAARAADLRAFIDAFTVAGLRPEAFSTSYGLSEATATVSGGPTGRVLSTLRLDRDALADNRVVGAAPGDTDAVEVAGSGPPVAGQLIVIVDPETRQECGPDQVGEIWIAGSNVVQGYWRRPEQNEQVFHAMLADTGEGPFLRTGDLGLLRGGELFVLGRCTDLVTVRGGNYYPDSIEATVAGAHPELGSRRAAAFSYNPGTGTGERLVVVCEINADRVAETELGEIADAARTAVDSSHGLSLGSLWLVRCGTLPATVLGKVQRSRCRQGYLDRTLDTVAEWYAPEPPPASGATLGQAIFRQDVHEARARRAAEAQRGRHRR